MLRKYVVSTCETKGIKLLHTNICSLRPKDPKEIEVGYFDSVEKAVEAASEYCLYLEICEDCCIKEKNSLNIRIRRTEA